jgi:DNA primase
VDGVVVNYDPDPAGRAATLRSMAPLVTRGLRVRVLRVPAGEDPDSYVRRVGAAEYRAQLGAAPEYMDYAIEEAIAGKDQRTARNKVMILNEILPLLGAIESPIERSRYVPVLADRLAVEDSLIHAEIAKAVRERKTTIAPPPPREQRLTVSLAEAGLVRVLVEVPESRPELLPLLEKEWLGNLQTWPVLAMIRELAAREENIDYVALIDRMRGQDAERLISLIAEQADPVGDTAHGRDCLDTIELDALQAECRKIQRRIEATSDDRLHATLAARKFELSQRIRELS